MLDALAPELARSTYFPSCDRTGITTKERERWLRARREGLGGSEVAAVLGVHPYKSALEVYADKVGATEGAQQRERTSEVALWGQIFEEPIALEYARRTDRDVELSNELYRRRGRPWHLVTPDALQSPAAAPPPYEGPGTLEVKTTGYGNWAEEIPAFVLIQVQHGLSVLDADWGTLVWLPFPERKLQWRDFGKHPEFQALLNERVDEFWTRVLQRRPPDADGSESSKRALYALEPELADECILLAGADELADEVERINRHLTMLEARKDLISQRVMQTLGDYKRGILEDGRYWTSWTVAPREEKCSHCSEVQRVVDGFRAVRLLQERKKPHGIPRETRALTVAPADDELADLLTATLERVK